MIALVLIVVGVAMMLYAWNANRPARQARRAHRRSIPRWGSKAWRAQPRSERGKPRA